MRRILKRLQVSLPHKAGFNTIDNPYTNKEFFKICEDYKVPHNPMKYRNEKFYWTYQCGVGWPANKLNDLILNLTPESITQNSGIE